MIPWLTVWPKFDIPEAAGFGVVPMLDAGDGGGLRESLNAETNIVALETAAQ